MKTVSDWQNLIAAGRKNAFERDKVPSNAFLLSLASGARFTPLGILTFAALVLIGAPIAVAGTLALFLLGIILIIPVTFLVIANFLIRRFSGKEQRSLGTILWNGVRSRIKRLIPVWLIRDLTGSELTKIAQKASHKAKVDVWYVPHIGYSSGIHLISPRVFLFADFVFHDAPDGFPASYIHQVGQGIRMTLSQSDHIIAISDHVKRRHLEGVFDYPEDRISVIRHGYVDISKLLPHLAGDRGHDATALMKVSKTPESLQRSSEIIHRGLATIYNKNKASFGKIYKNIVFPYLRKLDFSQHRYAIVSTQKPPLQEYVSGHQGR